MCQKDPQRQGSRRSSLGPSAQGAGETGPCWVPGEILKSPEGDHGTHPLAQWGEAAVHEELSAVPQQVRVGDADGHGHPAGRGKVGSELAGRRAGPKSCSCPGSLSEPDWHESPPKWALICIEFGGGRG